MVIFLTFLIIKIFNFNFNQFFFLFLEYYNKFLFINNFITNYRANNESGTKGTEDELFAWEAREYLRKKLVGKKVFFKTAGQQVSGGGKTTRYYGDIFYPTLENNIANELVENGFVSVKPVKSNNPTPEIQTLLDLQNKAKAAKVGKHDPNASKNNTRKNNSIDDVEAFLKKNSKKRIKAVVESVIDGSTIKLMLLPEGYMITLYISGIKCPSESEEFGDEAKFFVEIRLLQKDVEVTLEGVLSNNKTPSFFGTIYHPAGEIAVELVKQGFATCQNRSMKYLEGSADKLRAAERQAKEKKLRKWQKYTHTGPEIAEKEIVGTVIEIVREEALLLKTSHHDKPKKIFLSNIKPARLGIEAPRTYENSGDDQPPAPRAPRTLAKHFYEIPWAYEAREFLRTRCIGKKVTASVDYIQPKSDKFEEKICATVTVNGINLAEELVKEGLATVMNNPRDDQMSQCFDDLKKAEEIAKQSHKGLYSKSPPPKQRITDCSSAGDSARAKALLPSLQRFPRFEALVEYVASGSRMRLYVRREYSLITFLLAGITCPSGERPNQGDQPSAAEEYHQEALAFTKEKIMHREVEITVESCNKGGSMIGWLFVGNTNLSLALVKEGLAKVHRSAERSEYFKLLQQAEKEAKDKKLNLWKNYVEQPESEANNNTSKPAHEDVVKERKTNFVEVLVSEVSPELHVFVQPVSEGPKLESLTDNLRKYFDSNPPTPGSYSPKRGEICAAKFKEDQQWYRAKVEKIVGQNIHVLYIDYGNRDVVTVDECANLPSTFKNDRPYAKEYGFALVKLPKLPEYQEDSILEVREEFINKTININEEYTYDNITHITVKDTDKKEDLVKKLVEEGFLLVDRRRERYLQKLLTEYIEAQEKAKKDRLHMWEYGDITEDDAKEFGYAK
uniref:Staphylococcal nuclease domain-containing protein 1 n=1 Tax=Sipha flava TaxID=143950 RepID=A0A2S2Q6G9_9HEMI